MAIKITDECYNCNMCEPACPNNAIYPAGIEWAIQDGTSVKGSYMLANGKEIAAGENQAPLSLDIYYIVPDKCTECQGFHTEPQCAAACPVDCCVPDEQYVETVEELMGKKDRLHL